VIERGETERNGNRGRSQLAGSKWGTLASKASQLAVEGDRARRASQLAGFQSRSGESGNQPAGLGLPYIWNGGQLAGSKWGTLASKASQLAFEVDRHGAQAS
jgi:hypothetical protein